MIHETRRHLVNVTSTVATQPTSTPLCSCTHHNALTCIAEQSGMSRFNAMFLHATDITKMNGQCMCTCHINDDGHPMSQGEWTTQRNRPGKRGGFLNFKGKAGHHTQKSEVRS